MEEKDRIGRVEGKERKVRTKEGGGKREREK
jgi:hypothetical protein